MLPVKLTVEDLKDHLREQVELLLLYCSQFDQGNKVVAKPMAATLRTLLHTNPKKSSKIRGLLDQLNILNRRWRNVGTESDIRFVYANCKIIDFRGTAKVVAEEDGGILLQEAAYLPCLHDPRKGGVRRVLFKSWWDEPIFYNKNTKASFSRRQIVLSLANTDGGTHVDAEISPSYASFRAGDFLPARLAWGRNKDLSENEENPFLIGISCNPGLTGRNEAVFQGAVAAAIRTIAHEVLLTLEVRASYAFKLPYAWEPPQ